MTTDIRPGEGERVDELIDRVAAAMTAVPLDPAFAARLAGRLPARRTLWLEPRGMVVAALAVAVVAFAVSVTIRRADLQWGPAGRMSAGVPAPATAGGTASPPSTTIEAPVDGPVEATVATDRTRTARSAARPRRTYISHDHIVPQIAALGGPAALGVDDVDPMFLTIEPVELAPLDLANLTFNDLDSPDHPKE